MARRTRTLARWITTCAVVVATGLLMTVGAARADRWQPLRDDPTISSGLTVIAVGRRIQDQCDEIAPRMLRALAFAEALVDHAEALGFTRAELNAYIDDRDEQNRYREIARAYFAARGTAWDDPAGLCRLGRDEISAGSQIGRLLR